MTQIDLTPDFERMFPVMLEQACTQGNAQTMFEAFETSTIDCDRADLLREVQRWFAPLVIAANCATTVDAIQELRGVMADMLSEIDQEAARLERLAQGDNPEDDDPTDGEGLL